MGVLAHYAKKSHPEKCAKNPTQKKTGLTGNPKVSNPKVKWETTKKPEKTGFNWKNGKWKNGKV